MQKNLLRSLANVSGMTFIARIMGLLREVIMAKYFGAGMATDALFVAFKLPNLLRRIFAEGAFSQAFVPILAEYKTKRSEAETHKFVANVAGLLSLVLIIFTVIGILGASVIVMLTAPGFIHEPYKYDLTVHLLRITFAYIFLISLASMVSGVLNTWRIFSVPALTPAILNLVWIMFAIFFRQYFHPQILAIAVAIVIGGVLQLLFQVPFLLKIGMPVIPRLDLKNSAVWRVVKLMGPAIFAMSIAQISLVINTIFASILPNGSVSWLYYADRLMEFPSGVLGVALGTILLPSLSKHAANKDLINFSQTLDWGIKLCLMLALPAIVGLGVAAKPITMTLFMYGKFSMFDVIMTKRALVAYSIGLIGIIFVKVFAPGFYANQDIKTPVKIALVVLVCTQLMNLIFIVPFKHAGLALSVGLGCCINAACLYYFLKKKGIYVSQTNNWKIFLIKLAVSAVVMAVTLELGLHYLPFNFSGRAVFRWLSLLIMVILAAISYFGTLRLQGLRVREFIFHEVD